MAPDGSPPFKPAATDPMMGEDALSEELQLLYRDTEISLEPQPITQAVWGAQEWAHGSTIDPSLLSSTGYTHTPPGVGVQTGPFLDVDPPDGDSQMFPQARASDGLNGAEDQMSPVDQYSPISSITMSDSSSEFNLEHYIDGLDRSGTPVAGTLTEPFHLLGVGVGSAPPAADSPAMATLPFVLLTVMLYSRHYGWHDKPLRCPKEDEGCPYRAQFNKEIEKHIWSRHVKWAEETNRKPIRKKCQRCGVILERPDFVKRHMDEVHGGIKRKRGPGG
ncbi:hypothetical protein BBK36DRAFT_1186193 [Trichoderma citrinoviride]|uniref:C2H2-type domain-containing protein n=1 Tax=Trichoderma citrinoviride TaxID=58853 RepID=A0A2T4AY64_9HYPO|nr:hypothetical protein BBK36DRAFT_1186193 [Trichoderma citrinoviride]PTB62024.1 hypothetical protein BBK36DRAFT_1186193 [Trichoderma citrinoviride]